MLDLRMLAAVAGGAALGGSARYLITHLAFRFGLVDAFVATALINVTGSVLIGIVVETWNLRPGFDPVLRGFLTTGILGGYTTFSTFSLETVALISTGRTLVAAAYALGSVALGIAGCAGGIVLVRAML